MNQLVDMIKMFVDSSLKVISVKFLDLKGLSTQVLNFDKNLKNQAEINLDLMKMVEVQMKQHKNIFVCFLAAL